MKYEMRMVHLSVGQGMGTFLEVYDADTKELAHTALFDFGTTQAKHDEGDNAIAYVAAKLNSMKHPTLDAVVLSHSDEDHISLLTKLLPYFNPYGSSKLKELKVDYAVYGGAWENYLKRRVNVLLELEPYMAWHTALKDREPRTAGYLICTFAGSPAKPVHEFGPIKLYFLVANHPDAVTGPAPIPSKAKPNAYAKNTVSVMTVISYPGLEMIETGDATGATIRWANLALGKYNPTAYINTVFGMQVPHHGSRNTMATLGKAQAVGVTWQKNLQAFLAWMKSWSYTVSAANKSMHRHPNAEILQFFYNTLKDDTFYQDPGIAPYHYYNAFFETDKFTQSVGGGKVAPWPGSWGSGSGAKAPPIKGPPKKKAKIDKDAPPKRCDLFQLTVRNRRAMYSNVYYAAGVDNHQLTAVPPDPVDDTKNSYPSGSTPVLFYNWAYTTWYDPAAITSLTPEVPKKSVVALRKALDAGVPLSELPWPSEEEIEQWSRESDAAIAQQNAQPSPMRGTGGPPPSGVRPAPRMTAAPPPSHPPAAAQPEVLPLFAPSVGTPGGAGPALPGPGSRMGRLKVIR